MSSSKKMMRMAVGSGATHHLFDAHCNAGREGQTQQTMVQLIFQQK
jgi:hypothetical protein